MMTTGELALDKDGKILAVRISGISNMGGYLSVYAPFIPTLAGGRILGGVYRVPSLYVNVKGYFSNTAPVDAYRGSGRPEAAYLMERLMDAAALNPHDADAQYQLGIIYQERRQYGEAIASFEQAIKIDKMEADAHYQLGCIAREQGRYPPSAANCAASALPITSRSPALLARSRPRSSSPRMAGSNFIAERSRTDKAMKHRSRSSSPTSLACRSNPSR